MGSATAIDSGGYIKVKPDTTTTYVVMMDLCGNVTYDTVTVFVWPLTSSIIHQLDKLNVFPNPATDVVNVSGLMGSVNYQLENMIGFTMLRGVLDKNCYSIDVSRLTPGVYVLNLFASGAGNHVFLLVKE